jgi:hypothetical protein
MEDWKGLERIEETEVLTRKRRIGEKRKILKY